MSIVFENIDTNETVAIDRELEGKYYKAKLAAVINSSNLGPNADRGQDYGYRLAADQQALIEEWEEDPEVIDKVATFTRVPVDSLTHTDFLDYMLHQQELGYSPEKSQLADRRESQAEYEARVAASKAKIKAQAQSVDIPKPAKK